MRHSSSSALFGHWQSRKGSQAAPSRAGFDLETCGHVLGDAFVLTGRTPSDAAFSFAGSRLCALFGQDLKHRGWPGEWTEEAQSLFGDFLLFAADEQIGTVAGVRATLPTGQSVALELLLLPFQPVEGATAQVVGSLAPLSNARALSGASLDITSWRHLGDYAAPDQRRAVPRMVRKVRLACGFLLYEGSAKAGRAGANAI